MKFKKGDHVRIVAVNHLIGAADADNGSVKGFVETRVTHGETGKIVDDAYQDEGYVDVKFDNLKDPYDRTLALVQQIATRCVEKIEDGPSVMKEPMEMGSVIAARVKNQMAYDEKFYLFTRVNSDPLDPETDDEGSWADRDGVLFEWGELVEHRSAFPYERKTGKVITYLTKCPTKPGVVVIARDAADDDPSSTIMLTHVGNGKFYTLDGHSLYWMDIESARLATDEEIEALEGED